MKYFVVTFRGKDLDKKIRVHHNTVEKIESEIETYRRKEEIVAMDYAVKRVFGKKTSFWIDRETSIPESCVYIGQVVEPLSQKLGGGFNCVTGSIMITVEAPK